LLFNKTGQPLKQTIVFNVSSVKEFTPGGSNMQVKRVTSIAQTENYQDLTTGSYLYNVKWSAINVGTTSGTERAWTAADNFESCGYQKTNVLVDIVSPSEELIKIKAGPIS